MSTRTLEIKGTSGPAGHRIPLSVLSQKLSSPYPNPHAPLAGSQSSGLPVRKSQQLALQLEEDLV